MREEIRPYVDEAFEIVKHAANEIGPRLPGGENEKKFHDYMGEKLKGIGLKPTTEPFSVAPRASIGGIPYAGWVGVALSVMTYFALNIRSLWALMAIVSMCTWVWLVCSVFLYKRWFDCFFPQKISRNTYGELLPPDGKYDYTIILSGHTDTSWNWKHSEKNYARRGSHIWGLVITYAKVGFGVICFLLHTLISIFMSLTYSGLFSWTKSPEFINFFIKFRESLYFLPVVLAIGCAFIIMWNDSDEKNASPGAMDNATGIALAYSVTKYFKDNPDKMPKNCRIIDFNCGAEEAGLRGSMAFTTEHRGEDILKNAWNINIDSVADDDYFEVVIKDDWQFTRFDKDLEQMFKDTFKEMKIESKTNGCIHNPVGGCDSTPLTKAGVKSVTFAAQRPELTYYYHTFRDTPDRFSPETVGKGFEVILGVIDKIGKFQAENGYNGPRTK